MANSPNVLDEILSMPNTEPDVAPSAPQPPPAPLAPGVGGGPTGRGDTIKVQVEGVPAPLEFEPGTSPEVIQSVVKRVASQQPPSPSGGNLPHVPEGMGAAGAAGGATFGATVGGPPGAAIGASSEVIALSIAAGLVKSVLVMIGTPFVAKWIGLDNPRTAMIFGGMMGTTSGVCGGLAATDPKLVPYGAMTSTFYTGLGCLMGPSVLFLPTRAMFG